MNTTTNAATWTLMNTSITRTTRYGYSNTCTLAGAMINRQRKHCNNLAACFGSLGMAIGITLASKSARRARIAR